MSEPTHRELMNLDVTIAHRVLPLLKAFRATTTNYPEDLIDKGDLDAWHAELDQMIEAFERVADLDGGKTAPYDLAHRAKLALFASRLNEMWM